MYVVHPLGMGQLAGGGVCCRVASLAPGKNSVGVAPDPMTPVKMELLTGLPPPVSGTMRGWSSWKPKVFQARARAAAAANSKGMPRRAAIRRPGTRPSAGAARAAGNGMGLAAWYSGQATWSLVKQYFCW